MKLELEWYFQSIIGKARLYGLYSVPGAGESDLFMYVSRLAVKQENGNPIVFSLEMSEKMWRERMLGMGLSVEGIDVVDTAYSLEDIKNRIDECDPSIVLIHYLELVDGKEVISKLKEIAYEKNTAIIVAGHLGRNCGDCDPMYRRPQLFDLLWVYDRSRSVDEFLSDMRAYDTILFLHRNHDCIRGIGSAYRYNFCNTAEISVYENFASRPPIYIYFDFESISENNVDTSEISVK